MVAELPRLPDLESYLSDDDAKADGYWCLGGTKIQCEAGFRCVGGERRACNDAGLYCPEAGLQEARQCPAGAKCSAAAVEGQCASNQVSVDGACTRTGGGSDQRDCDQCTQ